MVLKSTDRQIAVSICAIAVIALCLNRSSGRTLHARQDDPLYLSEDTDQSRGRSAEVPEDIPPKGLYDVLWRVVHEVSGDRVAFVAAWVTCYLILALFPAYGAIVAL